MKLNLSERLTEEEQNEIRKRVFSFAEQMFMEGLSTGRDLNREPLHISAENFIKDRISYMTSFFINDDVWEIMPPQGYNPNPNIDVQKYNSETSELGANFDKMMDTAKNMQGMVNNVSEDNMPDWAKEQEKPEWSNQKKPF